MMTMLISPTIMGSTIKIYPSDDSFVRDRYPNNNYGTGAWFQDLRTGYNVNFGTDRSYFKFNLGVLQGKTINSAVFSIDPVFYQGSPLLNLNYVSNNNWDEETITWNNAPSYSTLISSKEVTSPDRIEFNIDSSYLEAGELSFALIENNEDTDVVFDSKDYYTGGSGDETRWPYLEINYNNGGIECPSTDYSNVCCSLNPIEMMGLINAFNNFETSYNPIEMMTFINKFNQFEPLC